MRRLFFAAVLAALWTTPGLAFAQCVESSPEGTWQYRYCPKGVAYERQYGYFGVWGEWTRVHPNVRTPCRWLSFEEMWQCRDRRIYCLKGTCG